MGKIMEVLTLLEGRLARSEHQVMYMQWSPHACFVIVW